VARLREHVMQRKREHDRICFKRREHFCEWNKLQHMFDYLHAANQPNH